MRDEAKEKEVLLREEGRFQQRMRKDKGKKGGREDETKYWFRIGGEGRKRETRRQQRTRRKKRTGIRNRRLER